MSSDSREPFMVTFHLSTGDPVRITVPIDEALSGALGHVGTFEDEGEQPTERHRAMARLVGGLTLDLERDTGSWNVRDTAGAVWAFLPRSIRAVSVTDPYVPETTRVVRVGYRSPEGT